MPIFACERRFSPPISAADFAAGGQALAPCLEVREAKWLTSNFAADGSRSVCLFEARDAESIREANRSAGLPFERIWEANVYRAT